MKKTATKVVLWMGFAAAVCVDGKPIEPLDVDLLNPMLYVSEPTYARIVLRQPTELFAFRAITSTGDSLIDEKSGGEPPSGGRISAWNYTC